MASTDPTVITIDVETGNYSSVSYPTLAPANNPTFTGTLNAFPATTVILPYNTSIGTVTSQELSYLSGVTSNIQSQINGIEITAVSGDLTLYKVGGTASLVFEGANPTNYRSYLTPIEPIDDYTFYVPAPSSTGSSVLVTDTLAQTLTNKTLTSPIINSGTLSSPTITGTINSLNLPTSTAGSKIISSYFYKAADTPNTSTSVPLVPTGFPTATGQVVKAGKTYHFKIVGLYSVSAVPTTINHRLNFTNGSVGSVTSYNSTTTTTMSGVGTQNWQTTSTQLITITPTANSQTSTMNMSLEGWFTPTGDGYFYYDFVGSANTTTIKYGTFMTISEVG